MQRTLQSPITFRPHPEGATTFKVVIIYEDFHSGKHGIKTYDYLVKNLEAQCEVSNQMWKFDILALPGLAELALKDAQKADIIMISTRGTNELPQATTNLLDRWLRKPGHALALVALFNEPESDRARETREYLSRVARRAGLEFFAQPDSFPGGVEASQAFRGDASLFPLGDVRTSNLQSPRWGINE